MKATALRVSVWTKTTIMVSAVLVTVLAIWAIDQFGSISAALSYIAGERLLVDSLSKSFGTVDAGTEQALAFSLINRTGHTVTILGAKTSCGCTVVANLPMSIPHGVSRSVPVVVRTAKLTGSLSSTVNLFSDNPKRGVITLHVRGSVRPLPRIESTVLREAHDAAY